MFRLARPLGVCAVASAALLSACADQAVAPDAVTAPVRTARISAPGAIAGRYLIRFRQGEPSDFAATIASMGGTIERRLPSGGMAVVRGIDAQGAATLTARRDLSAVAPDIAAQMIPAPASVQRLSYTGSTAPRINGTDQSGAFFFPMYQWNMRQVKADQAWSVTPGGAGKLVCVLDTGIDPDHLDIAGRVDPSLITSFVSDVSFPGNQDGIDYNSHGTSTAAYIVSNGFGVASVAPDARLCSAKVLGVTGSGSFIDMIVAIFWAAETAHADVINLSLGGYFDKEQPGGRALLTLLQASMDFATRKGITVVAAAGNSGIDLDEDPARFLFVPAQLNNVISVGATAPYNQANFDMLASYSNFGGKTGVDLVAPGGDLLTGGNILDLVISACSEYQVTLPFACTSVDYILSAGTSEAAPHVAGAAAVVGSIHPGATPAQINGCLVGSTDVVGPSRVFGAGRLNVLNASGC